MIHQDERQTDQMILLTNDLKPILKEKELDYDWTFYLKNNIKKKNEPKHWEYTKIELIGYKDDALYFKFPNGITQPLSYEELERTYYKL